jgi:hypothetical protein
MMISRRKEQDNRYWVRQTLSITGMLSYLLLFILVQCLLMLCFIRFHIDFAYLL